MLAVAVLALSLPAFGVPHAGAPQGLTILYTFAGAPDGADPNAAPIIDAAGNIFGTTLDGGSAGDGAVFELTPSGNAYSERVIHSFVGSDGAAPFGSPFASAGGDLFVTASAGGASQDGTIVELSRKHGAYEESGVFSFGLENGAYPAADFVESGKTLYTTTVDGGKYGYGAIVALSSAGTITDVYDFQNAPDGAYPQAGLVADSAGALYGTTYYGGSGSCPHGGHLFYRCGTVFRFVPSGSGGTETILWTFSGGAHGADPNGAVIVDKRGNLFGTTPFGGGMGCGTNGFPPGCGTVYELSPQGSTYREKIVHAFAGSDGSYPYAGLTAKGDSLYGTTEFGGADASGCGLGCGTIFEVSKSGSRFALLHSFEGSDGAQPLAALTAKGRAFYGTTSSGGAGSCGCGEVFAFSP